MSEILWCCHVRGPDEVHAAPDYKTALLWSDACLKLDRRQPRHEYEPFLSAVPAPWPWSVETHAENLPLAIVYFASTTSAVGDGK